MSMLFFKQPFTAEIAAEINGKNCAVYVREGGIDGCYHGIVSKVDDKTIKVGNDIVLNEFIIRVHCWG